LVSTKQKLFRMSYNFVSQSTETYAFQSLQAEIEKRSLKLAATIEATKKLEAKNYADLQELKRMNNNIEHRIAGTATPYPSLQADIEKRTLKLAASVETTKKLESKNYADLQELKQTNNNIERLLAENRRALEEFRSSIRTRK